MLSFFMPAFPTKAVIGFAVIVAIFAATFFSKTVASAGEFRVYTTIRQEAISTQEAQNKAGKKTTASKVVGRSLTFFRAGKFYDYMDEAGELVIFEPMLKQFTVINAKQMKATVVKFPELNQFLKVANKDARDRLKTLLQNSDPQSIETAKFLQFQLEPNFVQTANLKKLSVQLSGSQMTYTAECVKPKSSEMATAYLNYADWTAKMNSVLHLRALIPASRLQLNQSLREKKWFPVTVTLEAKAGSGFRLKATHQIQWELDKMDRSRINDWERLRKNASLEYLSFHQYQRATLVGN